MSCSQRCRTGTGVGEGACHPPPPPASHGALQTAGELLNCQWLSWKQSCKTEKLCLQKQSDMLAQPASAWPPPGLHLASASVLPPPGLHLASASPPPRLHQASASPLPCLLVFDPWYFLFQSRQSLVQSAASISLSLPPTFASRRAPNFPESWMPLVSPRITVVYTAPREVLTPMKLRHGVGRD